MGQVTPDAQAARALQEARAQAQTHLAQSIRTQIINREIERVSEDETDLTQSFQAFTERSTSITLPQTTEQTWFDEGQKTWFVLACVTRTSLHRFYKTKAQTAERELQRTYQRTVQMLQAKKKETALSNYFSGLTQVANYQELASIAAQTAPNGTNYAINPIWAARFGQVQTKIEAYKPQANSLEEAALNLITLLGLQVKKNQMAASFSIQFLPMAFENTRLATAFSAYFKTLLEAKAIQVLGWQPRRLDANEKKTDLEKQVQVSGQYFIEGENLRMLLFLNGEGSRWMAAAETRLPVSLAAQTGQAFKPQDTAQYTPLLTPHTANTGLLLEAWTNRGAAQVVLHSLETLKVIANVNRPAFLRLVYHFNDGRKALLLDNHYITERNANRPYEVPKTVVGQPPFGAEFIQVLASTEAFPPTEFTEERGVKWIQAPLSVFLRQSRAALQQTVTEVLIPVTTLE